jgi:hypothetical protein
VGFGQFKERVIPAYIVVIMLLFVVSPIILLRGTAHAVAGQLQSRSIQMSDDTVNTSASTASYLVQFNVQTTGNVEAIVVDVCSSDPIPGDACTLPTGYVAAATFTAGTNTASGWSASVANTNRTFELSNASGGSITSGATMSFTMTGVTNTTTLGTFYARIFTFATTGAATTWIAASGGNGSSLVGYVDYGGVAMSTAQPILVTSKVQEQLTFCVYTTSCGTQANILLGDTHDVLSTTLPAVDKNTLYSLSTNAAHGAVVYLKGATLTSGGNTIPAAGSSSFTWASGADFFGLCTYNSTLTVGSAPTVVTEYGGAGASGTCAGTVQDSGGALVSTAVGTPNPATFGLNTTNTLGTYGDQMASIAAPGASVNTVVLAASVSVTQASGVYTTTLQLIATGTY